MADKFNFSLLLYIVHLQALILAISLPVLAALHISDVSKLRPSQSTSLSQCSLQNLTSAEQRQMFQCYMGCLRDSCCKAVDITSCEQSYVSTEALDFVNEVRILGSYGLQTCQIHAQVHISVRYSRFVNTF